MYLGELTAQILRDMQARKVRSLLAMFGICWGTLSVIILLALGHGFYQYNRRNVLSIADGTVIFWTGRTHKSYKGMPKGATVHLKLKDLHALAKALPSIAMISPQIMRFHQPLSFRSKTINGTMVAVSADFNKIKQIKLAHGRFLNALDQRQHLHVVVLGSDLTTELFGTARAVGQQVLFQGVPFTVIGVLGSDPVHGRWLRRNAFMPATTAKDLWGDIDVQNFMVVPKNIQQTDQMIAQIKNYIAFREHFSSADDSALMVFDVTKLMQFFLDFFFAIEIFLGFCGFMTLAVGAVGVANVLFLIVTERTKEFGLRMALGAKPRDILTQVLLEAAIIVSLAGGMGVLLAVLAISVLQTVPLPHWLGMPDYSGAIILSTIGLLGLVAMLAGIFPARRAAQMMPVEALSF